MSLCSFNVFLFYIFIFSLLFHFLFIVYLVYEFIINIYTVCAYVGAVVKVRGRGLSPPCSDLSPCNSMSPLIESLTCYFMPK